MVEEWSGEHPFGLRCKEEERLGQKTRPERAYSLTSQSAN